MMMKPISLCSSTRVQQCSRRWKDDQAVVIKQDAIVPERPKGKQEEIGGEDSGSEEASTVGYSGTT